MNLQTVERGLFIGSLLLTLILLLKMWREKLHVEYRFLAMYLAWSALGALVLLPIPRDEMRYFYIFASFRFVEWILDVLITLDLVTLITKRYAGITSVARIAVSVCVAIATAGALLSAMIDLSSVRWQSYILKISQLVDRTISFSVLTFLGLMLIFLLWFPVKLSRNTVAYAAGFMIMFALRFSGLLLSNLLGQASNQPISAAQVGLFDVLLIYWTVKITVRNETAETVVGHAWDRTSERRLVSQLESINQSLLRSRSKANPR